MPSIRFVMVGGFLGAGKTTTIARLARAYQAQGHRVAVVTNDHAGELVDTHRLRAEGFDVGEIPGGCFCGSVDQFVATIEQLGQGERPEIVLVEPIGSCTDLVATVIRPLREQYGGRFEIAPYAVLLKPAHGLKILQKGQSHSAGQRGGFSPQAEYIFRKQLEEADFIVLNRVDQLSAEQVEELSRLLAEQHPNVPFIRASARTGQGFSAIQEMLDQRGEFGSRKLELDYSAYAEGEAALGWLNAGFSVHGPQPFDLDGLLFGILNRIGDALAVSGAETAHLKLIGLADEKCGVVNLVSSSDAPETSLLAGVNVPNARLIVNARVAADPALISASVLGAVQEACAASGVAAERRHLQCFRPGQTAPTLHSISLG
jgi:G3E family GTPase